MNFRIRLSQVLSLLSTMKQGDNVLGSFCLSVRPSVCRSPLSRLNRLTYDLDQSKVFVCVLSNRADAVDRLLISHQPVVKKPTLPQSLVKRGTGTKGKLLSPD